jgi:hypothetical protein
MQPIFAAMLSLQHKLNVRTIGDDWRNSNRENWHLAISQECAEGIDHLGWKWWAKHNLNADAARLEVIDILHFTLAAEMWESPNATLDQIATRLDRGWRERHSPIYLDEQRFDVSAGDPVQLFRLLSALATVERTNFGVLLLLAEKLHMDVEAVSILYRQKATLNLFRQNNGYRDGSYVKHWAPGLEDNTFLAVLSEGIDWRHATAQDLLYGRMNVKYLAVTSAMETH